MYSARATPGVLPGSPGIASADGIAGGLEDDPATDFYCVVGEPLEVAAQQRHVDCGCHAVLPFTVHEHRKQVPVQLVHGVVFVGNCLTARLPDSHAELRMRDGHVHDWAERMIVRITLDTDIDGARVAAERLARERAQSDG